MMVKGRYYAELVRRSDIGRCRIFYLWKQYRSMECDVPGWRAGRSILISNSSNVSLCSSVNTGKTHQAGMVCGHDAQIQQVEHGAHGLG